MRRRNDGGNYINLLVGSFIGVFSGNYIFGPILSVHFAEKEEEREKLHIKTRESQRSN